MLTASLAFANQFNQKPSNAQTPLKIIYASRTHSQLAQVIRELQNTAYQPRMAVLGSRAQMCVHDKVKQKHGALRNAACRALVSRRACEYHRNVDDKKAVYAEKILDIEDLVAEAEADKVCPYYMSRALEADAELVLMPYNYLLDPSIRRQMKMNLSNSVVILDEAHNVESICADAASFEMTSECVTNGVRDIDRLVHYVELSSAKEPPVAVDELLLLKKRLLALEVALLGRLERPNARGHRENAPIRGITYPGSEIRLLFGAEGLGVRAETLESELEFFDRVANLLQEESDSANRQTSNTSLHDIFNFVRIAFRRAPAGAGDVTEQYCVHVAQGQAPRRNDPMRRGAAASPGPTLNFWCFNPGLAMQDISELGVRSIVVTSGTLAPLSSFVAELNTPFDVRLENPHVIDREQLFVGVLKHGPDGASLISTYQNRSTESYLRSLGQTLVNFARVVPHGMLVFFPSYAAKGSCCDYWEQHGTMAAMRKLKEVCVEEQRGGALAFNAEISRFYEGAATRGAMFMGVCRGRASEGIDFANHNGRAVSITGLPYANRNADAKVLLKIRFMDRVASYKRSVKAPADSILTGDQWYRQQAVRAVNQAIGRVIRHRNDWGAIVLCDPRFASANVRGQLSRWLQPHVQTFEKFGDCQRKLSEFVRSRPETDQPIVKKLGKQTSESKTSEAAVRSSAALASSSSLSSSLLASRRRLLPPQGHVTKRKSIEAAHNLIAGLSSGSARANATGSQSSASSSSSLASDLATRYANSVSNKSATKKQKVAQKATFGTGTAKFIAEARRVLKDDYVVFKKLLTQFKSDNKMQDLVDGVRALFGTADRLHLLRDFAQFLKDDQRAMYNKMIATTMQSAIFGEPLSNSQSRKQARPIDRLKFDLVSGKKKR